ncbi:MAG: DUF2442 domain-containing protein [Oscillospiraceae bacterium]|nr:DUF2442 domain-containing protein [Oscillospiraceae bacterium]
MTNIPRLTNITTEKPYFLNLTYETGEKKRFDVTPYISGSWFGELADPNYFRAVKIIENGDYIEWPRGQDLAPHELYELSERIS